MFRLFIPIAFVIVFICWILYRILIKKDIKQNLNTVYLGLFFIVIWSLMYVFILK